MPDRADKFKPIKTRPEGVGGGRTTEIFNPSIHQFHFASLCGRPHNKTEETQSDGQDCEIGMIGGAGEWCSHRCGNAKSIPSRAKKRGQPNLYFARSHSLTSLSKCRH